MKKIYQYRYYGEDNDNNTTKYDTGAKIGYSDLVSGTFLDPNKTPIVQLGIQSVPGGEFLINGSGDSIILGSTGIYELELGAEAEITSIKVMPATVKLVNDNANAYLLIDIMYEAEDE